MSDDLAVIPRTWGDLCKYFLPVSGGYTEESSFKTSTSPFTPLDLFNQPLCHDFVQVDQDIPNRLLSGYDRWLDARKIRERPLATSSRYLLRSYRHPLPNWRSELGAPSALHRFRALLDDLFEDVTEIEEYIPRLGVRRCDPRMRNANSS